ncbi:MAG: hypothetical protein U1A78_33830 [Polyangia bacterium]
MSDDRPDVELSPTAVSLRASSGSPVPAGKFPVRAETPETLQNFYSHVTNVTAITPETAAAMTHISDNNLRATEIIERERTRRAQMRERYMLGKELSRLVILSGFVLCFVLCIGGGISTGWAIVISTFLGVFGGTTVVDKILNARRPEEPPPPMTPLPGG